MKKPHPIPSFLSNISIDKTPPGWSLDYEVLSHFCSGHGMANSSYGLDITQQYQIYAGQLFCLLIPTNEMKAIVKALMISDLQIKRMGLFWITHL